MTVAPSLAGLFAAFQALNDDGGAVKPVAAFLRGYRRSFRRTAPLGLAAVALLLFLGVDLVVVQSMPAAALLVPLIVVAAAVTVSVAVTGDCRRRTSARSQAQEPAQGIPLPLRPALVPEPGHAGPARHHRLRCLLQPVLGVALAPAPLLFVVWSNASYAFHAARTSTAS